jgi:membrane protease YdiL (CAAX protease family)
MADPTSRPTPLFEAAASPPGGRVTRLAVAFELGLGLVAMVVAWLVGYPLLTTIRPSVPGSALALLATLPLLGALWGLLTSNWPPIRRLVDELERSVIPLFRRCTAIQLFAIAAAAGIGEELLFRGLIQGAITSAAGPAIGLFAASLLFGLAHAITGIYAVLAAVVGVYLGLLGLLTGGVWVPIVVHALYDLVALTVSTRSHRTDPVPEEAEDEASSH